MSMFLSGGGENMTRKYGVFRLDVEILQSSNSCVVISAISNVSVNGGGNIVCECCKFVNVKRFDSRQEVVERFLSVNPLICSIR